MTKIRKTYTREFKIEALHLADTSGKTKAQVERDLGLSQGLLFHWRQELAQQGGEAFPGQSLSWALPRDGMRSSGRPYPP